MSARYCVGSPNKCPKCDGPMGDDFMPIYNGDYDQHIEVCGECYDALHQAYARHHKAWIESYWQDTFDTIIHTNDERVHGERE